MPKLRQRTDKGPVTATPSRTYWGRRVELTAVLPPSYAPPGSPVTFYDNCLPAPRKVLGTVPLMNNVAQLRITADKLHLGANDLQASVQLNPSGRSAESVCSPNAVTVLPVAR